MNKNLFLYVLNTIGLAACGSLAHAQSETDTLRRDTVMLEEVQISTGYQTLPAERMTGSFERVDEKLFNRQISTDVISRLDGLVPGMLFDKRGATDRLLVRGLSSIGLTDSRPLIILDNFPYEGDLDAINPNDVASVTLLKDAASASIWGARAGNGVLVITTKRGQFGRPFRLSATSNVAVQEKPDLFYRPQIAPTDYIDNETMLFGRGVYDAALMNTRTWPAVTPVVDILDQQRRGLMSEAEAAARIDALRGHDLRDDESRYLYRDAVMQQYALSLSGGSDRLNTLLSAGYDRNLQSERGNGYTRTTVRSQTSLRPVDALSLDIGIAYSANERQANHPGAIRMGATGGIYPYASLVDEQGRPAVVVRDRRLGYADTAGAGRLLDWRYRPYEELSLADNTTKLQNLLFNLSARYQWTAHLSTEVRGQYENQWSDSRQLQDERSYYVRDLINSFTQLAGDNVIRPVPLGGILDAGRSRLQAYGLRGQANYRRDWAAHSVAAIAGGEVRHAGTESGSDRLYGYDADLRISQGVDYANQYPRYTSPSSRAFIPYVGSGSRTVSRFVSLYANASYTYNGRYTASASARRDASNLFGVATNDRWSPFWSAGLAWDIAKEPFYAWSAMPHLKLRSTYGHAGNVDNGRAAVTTIEYRGYSRLGRFPYAIVANPPNPELRWEDVATWNIGLDFATKGRYLSGSIEYYVKDATDLISTIVADPTSGFTSFARNSASIRNRGLDISLQGRADVGVFGWIGDLLFSHNTNMLTEYHNDPWSYSSSVGTGNNIAPFVGRTPYALISYRFAGLDPENGDPMGYLNGEVSNDYNNITRNATEEDVVLHGSTLATYFGAFRNTFTWKNLSVSANVTYRFGYFFRRETVAYASFLSGGVAALHADYYKRWQHAGDERQTTVPSMRIPGSANRDAFYRDSEVTAERGDHIRLQDVNITYVFDMSNGRLPFRQIRATVYARNLGLLWKANDVGLDPDYLATPAARSIAFGLAMDF
ncbi:SusC/RagA family TonB-linked outer membrane protein [Parapedobacter koreensis]|uniref:TonB-linked outer membrane protein, SusC/RagA family n=1 Tax=Parapedobacter koreensis TaxID=332977 RepID=A0A1H7U9E0_9SPHI|nr:SusC/RagA family TonB-linked outer membrane protein [Parapedobacter koreensis]SEL93632.1 TonB-linked outer membrane protein, SusC/RagA family [Parapedobacter koreensis]